MIEPRELTVVLKYLRANLRVCGEALQGLRDHMSRRFESMDRRFESVERQLGLLTDAVRTPSKELHRLEATLDAHGDRLDKLEDAAE